MLCVTKSRIMTENIQTCINTFVVQFTRSCISLRVLNATEIQQMTALNKWAWNFVQRRDRYRETDVCHGVFDRRSRTVLQIGHTSQFNLNLAEFSVLQGSAWFDRNVCNWLYDMQTHRYWMCSVLSSLSSLLFLSVVNCCPNGLLCREPELWYFQCF